MKEKTKVLHLTSSLEMGGAEKLLLNLIAENSKTSKVDFTVVVMNDLVNEELKKELLSYGCKVYFLNRNPAHRHPKYLFHLIRIIRRHRIQVIHSHTYGSKLWAILCKMAIPRLKVAFTIHDMNVIKGLNALHVFLHKKIINRNIAISNAVLKESKKRNILNTSVIYNGILTENYLRYKKENYTLNEPLKIVNVARITYRIKGQDILIRAVKKCKDKGLHISCTFIGGVYDYDKESYEYLKQLIDTLGLQNEIHFLGNRTDVDRLLPQYDVFVLPSRSEGLGLVILEAMASGVPVIASNIDGPAELIEHGSNGYLFESENDSDLADKLVELTAQSLLLEHAAKNALDRVGDFDTSVMLDNYYSMYNELISSHK